MMLPAGLTTAPPAPSSASVSPDSPPSTTDSTAPKLDYRTLQNWLAGLLAEWGAAAIPSTGSNATGQQTGKVHPADAAEVGTSAVAPPAESVAGIRPAPKSDGNTNPTQAAAALSSLVLPTENAGQPPTTFLSAGQPALPFSREPPASAAVTPGAAGSPVGATQITGSQSTESPAPALPDAISGKEVTTAQLELSPGNDPRGMTPAPSGADPSLSARLLSGALAKAQDVSIAAAAQAGPQNLAAPWSGSLTQHFAVGGETAAAAIAGLATEATGQGAKAEKVNATTGANGSTVSWQAGTTPATERPQAAPVVQIGTEIIARAQQLGPEGRTDFHFQLQPPELGTVRVHLSSVDGQVSARLVVREDGTRQLLQTHLDSLVQRLSQAGISLGRFDVAQDGAGFQERWQNANAPTAGERAPAIPVTAAPENPAAGSPASSRNQIDVIA